MSLILHANMPLQLSCDLRLTTAKNKAPLLGMSSNFQSLWAVAGITGCLQRPETKHKPFPITQLASPSLFPAEAKEKPFTAPNRITTVN